MTQMTSHERFKRMYEHREADRVPIIDSPWEATIERWRREGMPEDVYFTNFFGLDHVAHIGVDISPRYEAKVIEETETYTISTTPYGVTLRTWKHAASTPEFLDFTVTDRDSWAKTKERMTPSRDRVDWDYLKRDYRKWREGGCWIVGGLWFGFDVTHAWLVGTERLLMALMTDPDWCIDMFNHYLDVNLALLDAIWAEGYEFDCVGWPDDMGFKNKQFFSVETYREVLKPIHKRAVDWRTRKALRPTSTPAAMCARSCPNSSRSASTPSIPSKSRPAWTPSNSSGNTESSLSSTAESMRCSGTTPRPSRRRCVASCPF